MFRLQRISKLFGKRDLDCVEVRKLSSDYLEGDLKPSLLERFQAHISACGPCQAFVESVRSVMGMLADLPKVEAPPDLKRSIIERTTRKGKGETSGA